LTDAGPLQAFELLDYRPLNFVACLPHS
jgi:hypothetical protein